MVQNVKNWAATYGILLAVLAGLMWLATTQLGMFTGFSVADMAITFGLLTAGLIGAQRYLPRLQAIAGFSFMQWLIVIMVVTIVSIIAYVYALYVPSLAAIGYQNLGFGKADVTSTETFQFLLYGLGIIAVSFVLAEFILVVSTGKTDWRLLLGLVLVSAAFLVLLVAGVFGEGQRVEYQTQRAQSEATSVVTLLETQAPPFVTLQRSITAARAPHQQIIADGSLEGDNARQDVLRNARNAVNSCQALPAALTTLIAGATAIPEAERSGGSVTSASGQEGEGPRYRALARALQGVMAEPSSAVTDAMALVRTPNIPQTAEPTTAQLLGAVSNRCDVVAAELQRRIDALKTAQSANLGAAFSADEANFVRQQQLQPVISAAEAVLSNVVAMPDLTLLVTEEADTPAMASARVALSQLDELSDAVTAADDAFQVRVDDLRGNVDDINWDAPQSVVEEQMREYFAEIGAVAIAFQTNQAQDILSLAAAVGDETLQDDLQNIITGYNAPRITTPDEATLYDTWFENGGEGIWNFVLALLLALTTETLVLWGTTYLVVALGKRFHAIGEERKQSSSSPAVFTRTS